MAPVREYEPALGFRGTSTLVAGYLGIQFAANLTAVKTVAILDGRPIPIGSLLYAVSFTWIDLVNEHLGRRCARWLVVSSVGANALIILWFQLYVHLPGTSEWNMDGGRQEAVAFVMGTTPRVLIASLVTMYIAENVDILVYHRVRAFLPARRCWLTSAVSNTASAPLDGVLFALIAFAGKVPIDFLWSLMLTSALYKLAVAYASVPLNYAIVPRRARAVGEESG